MARLARVAVTIAVLCRTHITRPSPPLTRDSPSLSDSVELVSSIAATLMMEVAWRTPWCSTRDKFQKNDVKMTPIVVSNFPGLPVCFQGRAGNGAIME